MKFVVHFSFDTPANRGRLSLVWDAETSGKCEAEVLDHLTSTDVFKNTNVTIDSVCPATDVDLEDFNHPEPQVS